MQYIVIANSVVVTDIMFVLLDGLSVPSRGGLLEISRAPSNGRIMFYLIKIIVRVGLSTSSCFVAIHYEGTYSSCGVFGTRFN